MTGRSDAMNGSPLAGAGFWPRRERTSYYEQICQPETLARAWRSVRRGGGAGSDVRGFFEEVDHRRVLDAFRATTRDEALTGLVAQWLEHGVLQPEEPEPPEEPDIPEDGEPAAEAAPAGIAGRVRSGLELAS